MTTAKVNPRKIKPPTAPGVTLEVSNPLGDGNGSGEAPCNIESK